MTDLQTREANGGVGGPEPYPDAPPPGGRTAHHPAVTPEGPVQDDGPVPGAPQAAAFGLVLRRVDRSRSALSVSGELDRLTTPVLVGCLDGLLRDRPPGTCLVIDLSGTSFVDVGGLNALLDVQRRLAVRGITLHVGACRAQFRRLLWATRTTGLTAPAPDGHRPFRCLGYRRSGDRSRRLDPVSSVRRCRARR